MILRFFTLMLFLSSCSSGCSDESRRSQLDAREEKVNQKQMQLIALEQKIIEKQEALDRREKILDSISLRLRPKSSGDSAINDTISEVSYLDGMWTVSLTCTKSTCENFAVGDFKSEIWRITTMKPNRILTEVVSNQLHKVYAGFADSNMINLKQYNQKADSTSAGNSDIRLKINTQNRIDGEKELIRKDCRVLYSVKMEKQ